MTDAEFIAWLSSPDARPVVLVEAAVRLDGIETVLNISDMGYTTKTGETPSNECYLPRIVGGCTIGERLSLDGSDASIAWGDVGIDNTDGFFDYLLGGIWRNRPIAMFVGDASWPRADFRQVFAGTIDDLDSSAPDRLNLKLRDNMQRLNAPLTEAKIGGCGPNKDATVPLCFGECHNVTPVLVDPATLTYQVHGGAIEDVIERRDGGVPVGGSNNLAAGTFALTANLVSDLTVSVQGDKSGGVYRDTIATLVQRIVTGYGTADGRLAASEIDAASFAAFDALNLMPVGLWCPDRTNVIDACRALTASVGAQVHFSPLGKLQITQVDIPSGGGEVIADEDAVDGEIEIAARPVVQVAVKLGFCRNWTVQTVQGGIPAEHRALYAQEWLTATSIDSAAQADYQTYAEPAMQETMLLVAADAQAEADRRQALWGVQRHVYRRPCGPHKMLLALGAGVTLTSRRYNLAAGKPGQVVAVTRDWLKRRATVEVLV